MDDVIHSTDSEGKLFQTQRELGLVFERASMKVHKWVTNHPRLWKSLPTADRAKSFSFASPEDTLMSHPATPDGPTVKALGVLYHAVVDQFQFFAPVPPERWTMRTLSSFVMQLFDPLELLSPVVQRGRRLVQLLWRLECKWDEPLPEEMKQVAQKYAKMLEGLHTIHINRCLRHPLALVGWEILCFTDASSHTMAACLYQRTLYANGSISCTLICSKMRLVPIRKQESVPRAETQAGVIGVKLAVDLAIAYGIDMRKLSFFSDSTTLLWWLRTTKPLSIFVANRVCQILDRTKVQQWNHVTTHENPADIPTRGESPEGLKNSNLWWEGPAFASRPRAEWPRQPKSSCPKKLQRKNCP